MITFFIISFIAGILTVFAPCILPLLPVIVGGSMSGGTNTRRVFTVVISLGVSIFLFTLLLKFSTALITIPSIFWQLLSGCLLIFFGIVTLAPSIWEQMPFVNKIYVGSNKLLGSGYLKQNIFGDIIVGAALGPVFSSCSPTYFVILAAVLPAHFATGVAYLLAYVLGLCLFLFIIAYVGQKVIIKLGVASGSKSIFKKTIGIIFILVGLAVIFGIDKKIEKSLPSGAFGEIGIEQKLLSLGSQNNSSSTNNAVSSSTDNLTKSINTNTNSAPTPLGYLSSMEKAIRYQKAPELEQIDGYINTNGGPINLKKYIGKNVVLVDFWDYSCINCQRTLPYVTAWYDKYKDKGLVVVGVHTPEFAFEHVQSNVQDAVNRFGIKYPVVLDNEYKTWGAFQNQYWPREYLIDIDGYIVHDHAGEGEYDQTEKAIQDALAERINRLNISSHIETSTVKISPINLSGIQSPETYFGSSRNEYLGNGSQGIQGPANFILPNNPKLNTLYLGGSWNILPEYAEAKVGGSIIFKYNSNDVYLVGANVNGDTKIKVLRDGKLLGSFAGADVDMKTGEATINGDRLYKLIHDSTPGVHTIEIQIENGTLDAYTFTFG